VLASAVLMFGVSLLTAPASDATQRQFFDG
jgi:hypothetical protein